MTTLEKILQEIDSAKDEYGMIDYINNKPVIAKEQVKEIIKKHLSAKDTNVTANDGKISIDDERLWQILFDEACVEGQQADRIYKQLKEICGDGWIPVEDGMPEEKINPVSRDFYEYQVTAKFGNAKDVRYYKYGNGHWWNGPGIVDKYVIAWRENPEPYRPEQPETCKYTGGSCCWPIDQCRDCPNHPERSDGE